jgi:FKBP-type peptidyl-prolyl cis-trans isomerase/predicted small secreted protein
MHPHPLAPRRLATAGLVLIALVLASCGGDDGTGEDAVFTDGSLVPIEEVPASPAGNTESGDTGSGAKPVVQVPEELPTELVITDLSRGTGRVAEPGDTVVVDYVGVRTADGTEFDNSYDRGTPFEVALGQGRVIAGWDEGLVGTQAGGRRQLDIPAALAYGDNPPGGSVIQPGDALTFVVDVRAVVGPVSAEDAPLDLEVEPSSGRTDLGVVDLSVGDGPELSTGQTGIVHVLLVRGDDQTIVYNTWEFGDPIQVLILEDATLAGLVDGLTGMRVGGRRIISIPPDLAFGDSGNTDIGLPPGVDLIVVADLVGVY